MPEVDYKYKEFYIKVRALIQTMNHRDIAHALTEIDINRIIVDKLNAYVYETEYKDGEE